MTIVRTCIAALLLVMPLSGAIAVPPPPPPPGQDALANRLVQAIEGKDASAYAALLSDDVKVVENGRMIAHDKREWLEKFGPKLSAEGVFFKLSPGFSGSNRLLFIEYFNSMASWGTYAPGDCCWSSDAVAYDIARGKIIMIHRLLGGSTELKKQGTPR